MIDVLFKQHNARHLSPREVAKTFVPPSFYSDLLEPKHAILIGPRGSGKTTLLKMLTTPALEAWTHHWAESARSAVNYTAVYVPSDITWREQFIAVEQLLGDTATAESLARSTFTAHLQRSFVASIMNRFQRYLEAGGATSQFRRLAVSEEGEEQLARRLSAKWLFGDPAPTLPILREMLSERIEGIYDIAQLEGTLGADGRAARIAAIPWLRISYLHSIPSLIEITNNALNEHDAKWAFLFDELEIAPVWLQRELYAAMRSIDQRVLFKLAMAPYMPFEPLASDVKPIGGQDFTPIPLLAQNHHSVAEFCTAIWNQLVEEKGLLPCTPQEVLGISQFGGEELNKYEEGSGFSDNVKQLKRKDTSFLNYVEHFKAAPSEWGKFDEKKRAQVLRKAYPIIYLRNYYLKASGRKSRKAHALFAGYNMVFNITEGNPRIIRGVFSSFLDLWRDQGKRIDNVAQARILRHAAEVFKSTLANAVAPQPKIRKWGTGVVPLLECIANFFAQGIYGHKFIADPVSSFIVDRDTPTDVSRAIGVAVNLGGAIQVNSLGDDAIGDVAGKRFRLCYLLALLEELPIRLGPGTKLSKILRRQSPVTMDAENLALDFAEDTE